MKFLLRLLLLAIALLLAVVALAPFTATGSRLLLAGVAKMSPLELRYLEGSLFGDLRLESVHLPLDGLSLVLDTFESRLDASCLWQSQVCLDFLRLGEVRLQVEPGTGDKDAGKAAAAPLDDLVEFPVALKCDELVIASLRVSWPGGEWGNRQLEGSLVTDASGLHLGDLRAEYALLRLDQDEDAAPGAGERIELPPVLLPFELSLEGLDIEEFAADLYGQAQTYQTFQLQGRWRGHALQLLRLGISHREWGELQLAGEIEFNADWPVRLTADLAVSEPLPWRPLDARTVTLRVDGDLAALAIDADVQGSQQLFLRAQIDVLDREFPFELQANGQWAQPVFLPELAGVPSNFPEIYLGSPLQLEARGNLLQQRFELSAAATGMGYDVMRLHMRGAHEDGEVQVEELHLADDAGSALQLAGQLQLGAEIGWQFVLDSPGFALPIYGSYPQGRVQGSLRTSGSSGDSDWLVTVDEVDIKGEVGGFPALVHGGVTLRPGELAAGSELWAEINGGRLQLVHGERPGVPAGARLTLEVDELGNWREGSRGSLQFRVALAASGEQLHVEGAANGVYWQGFALDEARGSGSYDLVEGRLPDLLLEGSGLQWEQWQLDSLQMTGRDDRQRQSLELVSTGDLQGRLVVSGALAGETWSGHLQPARLQTPLGNWELSAPVPMVLERKQRSLTLAAHCWHQGETRLCPGDSVFGPEGETSLQLQGPLDFLAALLPPESGLDSAVQLRADASWSQEQGLGASAKASMGPGRYTRQLGEGEVAAAAWENIGASFTLKDGALALDGHLDMLDGSASLQLTLPSRQEQALVGELRLDGLQLAGLSPFLPMLEEMHGVIDGRLVLSGTADEPGGDGVLTLSDGRLLMDNNPTALDQLQLRMSFHGNGATLDGNGLLGGGPVSLEGNLSLGDDPRLDLTVGGERNKLLIPPSLEMAVSQQLVIAATLERVDISGDIEVHDGVLEFEQLPEGSVGLSPDAVIVDYHGQEVQPRRPFDTSVDIRLHIDERFRVSGSALNTGVGGDLHLVQRPGTPLQLFGNLNIAGGELRAYGQRLVVQRGTISFVGAPDQPEMNLRADREITTGDVTVGVIVRGSLDALELELYSSPTMSQTEALSYLTRGRGMDSGAAVDGTALALSMGFSAINQSGAMSGLERLPGVNRIALGTGQLEDDTTAHVSGYLGERVYLSYGIGLHEPINVLTVRLYLQTRLWLEVVNSLENSLDLYYAFDIH